MGLPCEVNVGQYTVRGLSLGGVETYLQIPQFDLMFDVGHCPRSLAGTSNLCITHGHGDHAGGLIGMLSLRMLMGIKKPLELYAPKSITSGLRKAITAYESFQKHPYPININGVEPGDEIPMGQNRFLRPFKSYHVVDTVGYTIWERIKKLKAEFVGLPGPEIAKRKHAGDELFDVVERPLVSFPGDTTIKTLDREPHLYKSRVLLLESTYLDSRRTTEQCYKHGHIHLDQVLERAALFENEHLVLTHFSQAYQPKEARQLVESRCNGHFKPEVHALTPKSGGWPG